MTLLRLCLPLAGLLSGTALAVGIELETPRAGWRSGSAEGAHFLQEVHYPASVVRSAPDQGDSARILGRIRSAAKWDADTPARLVVNGIDMPLKVEQDGRFDRPFAFPAGSNSVELRSPDGQQRRRLQFYNRGSGETPAKLRVVLSWDSDATDLDLHLVTPDGGHVFYGERALANGAVLDVDVTGGYGPEMIATATPLKGEYLVYVNYYGGGYDHDGNALSELTTAQVTLITEEGSIDEKQERFLIPMRAPGELTLVKRFSYP